MPKQVSDHGEPRFPYTTQPQALRRLLAEIPKRPRPPKISLDTLKAWKVSSNNNARTAISVLKKLGLLGPNGEPTDIYAEFMKKEAGPAVLGKRIREVYKVLFENSHAPHNEPDHELRNLFNIHSGGADDAMRLQVQTFKALSEYANFDGSSDRPGVNGMESRVGDSVKSDNGTRLPPIQVDLHIHLPENKSSRDYEAIIQDIAKYIYGRKFDRS